MTAEPIDVEDPYEEILRLTAENERLRKERDEAQKAHREADSWLAESMRQRFALEADVSSLRELESAARAVDRAWREESGTGARVVAPLRILAAAVDALPPTPPATEGSDE